MMKIGNPWSQVRIGVLGLCLVSCGQWNGIPSAAPESRDVMQSPFDTPERWQQLAAPFHATYQYTQAILLLQRARELHVMKHGLAHPDTLATERTMVRTYMQLGNQVAIRGGVARAERLLVSAGKLCGEDPGCRAEVTHALGMLRVVRGDRPGAETLFQIAHEGAGHDLLVAMVSIHAAFGRLSDAEAILARARAAHQPLAGIDPKCQLALAVLGASLEDMRVTYAGPMKHLQQNLMAHERARGRVSTGVADALHALADAHAVRGSLDQAQALLAYALDIRRDRLAEDDPVITRTLNALSLVLAARGDVQSALLIREYTNVSIHMALEAALPNSSEEGILQRVSELRADTDALVSLHVRSAPGDQRAARLVLDSIFRDKGRALDMIAARTALLRTHSRERIRRHFGDWQPRLSRWEGRRRRRQRDAIEALEELGQLRGALAASVHHGDNPLETRRLERRIQELERRVIPLVGPEVPVYTSIAMIQRRIPKDGALIEFVQYAPFDLETWTRRAPRYAAYVLHAQGPPRGVDLGEASIIDDHIRQWREAISTHRPLDWVVELARVLDGELMERVRPLLGDVREVFVSPDGLLHLLPFAALVDERGDFLVEHFTFTYLNSGRDLVIQSRRTARAHGVVILADPDFDAMPTPGEQDVSLTAPELAGALGIESFAPLPGTAREAAALESLLPDAEIWTGGRATKARLMSLRSPKILHVATHGIFLGASTSSTGAGSWSDEPTSQVPGTPLQRAHAPLLQAALALTGANRTLRGIRSPGSGDGIMTALEVASLDLSGTNLVVLSACDTGIGSISVDRGLSGLRRALSVAGTETQILSLWPISDTGTVDLMRSYYQRLLGGTGRGAAMREVQRELLRRPETAHPFHWASFVVSGNPGPLDGLEHLASKSGHVSPQSEAARPAPPRAPERVLFWLPPDRVGYGYFSLQAHVRWVIENEPGLVQIDPVHIAQTKITLRLHDTKATVGQACRLGESVGAQWIILIYGLHRGQNKVVPVTFRGEQKYSWDETPRGRSSVWLSARFRVLEVGRCQISDEFPISSHISYSEGRKMDHEDAVLHMQYRFQQHLRRKLREVMWP